MRAGELRSDLVALGLDLANGVLGGLDPLVEPHRCCLLSAGTTPVGVGLGDLGLDIGTELRAVLGREHAPVGASEQQPEAIATGVALDLAGDRPTSTRVTTGAGVHRAVSPFGRAR